MGKIFFRSMLLLAACVSAWPQAPQPQFEVATIRQSPEETILDSFVPTIDATPGGTLRLQNRQLKELIMIAYNIGGKQLTGPPWLIYPPGRAGDVPRFDITAKVPDEATRDQVPRMLQNLLAERFGVRVHRESRQIMIYSLELGKSGMKAPPAPEGEHRASGCARSMFGQDGVTHAVCQNLSTGQFAQQLQTLAPGYFREGPVVDNTGLGNNYDFQLAWITQQQRDAGEDGPSMFDAIDKLGLHVDKKRGAVEVFVVDSAEPKPTEN